MGLEVVGEDARPGQRLDELELRLALPGERVTQRELDLLAVVAHLLEQRRLEPVGGPRSDAELRRETAHRLVEVANDERALLDRRRAERASRRRRPLMPAAGRSSTSTGSWAAEIVPSATSATRDETAALARLGDRPDAGDGQQAAPAVDLGRAVLGDAPDEVVELDRDRRRVDLGERQVVLGALGAEEVGGDTLQPEVAELCAKLGAAQRALAESRRRPAPPVRSNGTLIEPSRPWTLR